MTTKATSWERRLVDWAIMGIHSPPSKACVEVQDAVLRQAYELCAELTRYHSRTFHLASGLLPADKCRAVRALYAFCRTSDDIVDQADHHGEDPKVALEHWGERATSDCEDEEDAVVLAWADTQAAYRIPRLYAEQLIDGVARDLAQTRYQTFEELAIYCYGVASTVGLMSMYIIGFSDTAAIPYAVRLGVALQLTNILRDIGEDWRAGRLYLPLDDLAKFGLSEADIEAGEVNDEWRAFMRYQIKRVRQLYATSIPGVRYLHRSGRFAVSAAAELYRAILLDIEQHDMDVFHRRAYTTRNEKLRRLPGIWWRSYVSGYRDPNG